MVVDLFLRKSRNNDEFACIVRGRNRSDEKTESSVTKWRSCQHLFVKVRDSEYIGAFHSSDCETIPARYECVRCGLTNRLMDLEEKLDFNDYSTCIPNKKKITDESAEWRKQRPEITKETSLSDETLKTCHPGVLFDIAVELCLAQGIKTTKEKVFEIMKELCDMETTAEQLKISTVVHASALIERYKERHGFYSEKD